MTNNSEIVGQGAGKAKHLDGFISKIKGNIVAILSTLTLLAGFIVIPIYIKEKFVDPIEDFSSRIQLLDARVDSLTSTRKYDRLQQVHFHALCTNILEARTRAICEKDIEGLMELYDDYIEVRVALGPDEYGSARLQKQKLKEMMKPIIANIKSMKWSELTIQALADNKIKMKFSLLGDKLERGIVNGYENPAELIIQNFTPSGDIGQPNEDREQKWRIVSDKWIAYNIMFIR